MDDQIESLEKVELAMIRAEHQKKFQVMIEYVKEKVGEGIEYKNSIVRVVVSEHGAYYELLDLPEEFSGAATENVQRRFVTPSEATALLTRAYEASRRPIPDGTFRFTILALYTRRGLVDRKNCFIFDYRVDPQLTTSVPASIGKFQPGVMPLFFKLRVDGDLGREILGASSGIAFCMANAGDRHLLVQIPFDDDEIIELGALPDSPTVQ